MKQSHIIIICTVLSLLGGWVGSAVSFMDNKATQAIPNRVASTELTVKEVRSDVDRLKTEVAVTNQKVESIKEQLERIDNKLDKIGDRVGVKQ